jgi:hypothetical protein
MLMSLAVCAVVPLLLLSWNVGPWRRSPWPAALVLAWYGFGLLHLAAGNVRVPHQWDYGCFWLYGHIAAARANVYDPAVYAGMHLPFVPDEEFVSAVLRVGFPYPPPTIALFYPLGFIDSVPVGLALWYALNFAALGGAAWYLARTLLPDDGPRAALLVLAVIAALPASIMNVGDAQTNFLLLLVLALALRGEASAGGAVWAALALWIKPYAGALLLLDVLKRRGRRLAVIAATLAASLVTGALLVGPVAAGSYLRANPSGREPAWAFVEVVNQSLLAMVLRLQGTLPEHVVPLHEPLFVGAALLLSAITLYVCARSSAPTEASFAALLTLGMLVYPGTLNSYGVAIIIPLLVLWRGRERFPGRTAAVAALTLGAVAFQSPSVQHGFGANALMWLGCICLLRAHRTAGAGAESAVQSAPAVGGAR